MMTTGVELIWGKHIRDGEEAKEWHAPCGCAFHLLDLVKFRSAIASAMGRGAGMVYSEDMQALSATIKEGTEAVLATIVPHWHPCLAHQPATNGVLQHILEHMGELEEAWRRGAISEHDGQGGTRSNRNAKLRNDLEALVRGHISGS